MNSFDVAIIGGGPAGYVAAIRAAKLGLTTACVEKEPELGGTCVRIGCIPSKALLESSHRYASAKDELAEHGVRVGSVTADVGAMMARKEKIVSGLTAGVAYLFAKHKITRYQGVARLGTGRRVKVNDGSEEHEIEARHIIIATGSRPAPLPLAQPDGNLIGTSTDALMYERPPKTLVVIGAGYIGLELGSVWSRLGSKVVVLEYLDRILPGMDSELAAAAQARFEKQGIEFRIGSRIESVSTRGSTCSVGFEGGDSIKCDRLLIAAGRIPNTEGLGLEEAGVAEDERGRIIIDQDFRTSAEGIYAIGDVTGGAMLAHKASEEGVACVEKIATGYGHVNYDVIPGIVYTEPEIASVGKSEEQLKELGISYGRGVFPFSANGRAKCIGDSAGFVKVLADSVTDRVLGVHIIGARAGDLIAEAAAAMAFGASSEDIGTACHAHPTLSEALKEAALAVAGAQIHI